MQLSPGARLGPYEIVEPVGAGGMGEVYRARDSRLKRDVALKVLAFDVSNDPARSVRFEREARIAAALNHPNICTIYDVGVHDGVPYIVSEFLEGQTFRHLLEQGRVPLRRILDYASQAADGLSAAHEKGIIHRDLKPENLLLTPDGRVKILDFGIAKLAEDAGAEDVTHVASRERLTGVGMVIGTAGYMAPEQVRAQLCDGRSDIFSLGAVLFELLAGRRLFRGDTPADTAAAILNEDPPDLATENLTPPVVDRILRRCLEKNPRNRFQSAGDLAFALKALPGTVTSTMAGPTRVRRTFGWPVGLLAALVALPVLAAWIWMRPAGVDQSALRFTPFAMDGEQEDEPVWSPDGRTLAYRKYVEGHGQVLIRSLDAAEPFQLTHESGDATPVFWSPDGNRVAYLTSEGLWWASRAGGDAELIQKDTTILAAALSPDGRALAMWRTPETAHAVEGSVWIASPPTAPPRRYEPAPFAVKAALVPDYLKFSPDGRTLLLVHINDAGLAAAWLIPFPADARNPPRRVVPELHFRASFSWMPDNRHVVMSMPSQAAPFGGLWNVDVKTGAWVPITVGLTPQSDPAVTTDGSTLAFAAGTTKFGLAEVPLDGSAIHEILTTAADEYFGVWSPRQHKIVYVSRRTGRDEIRIRNMDDGSDQPVVALDALPAGSHALSAPVVSMDGQRIAFHVWGGDSIASIWVVPVTGGTPVRISSQGAAQAAAAWSPDGRELACLDFQSGRLRPVVLHIGSQAAPRVLSPSEDTDSVDVPAWSPDGRWIAYYRNSAIELISPLGAERRVIGPLHGFGLAWSQDSRVLYTVASGENGQKSLLAVDAATGARRELGTIPPDVDFATPTSPGMRLTLSPDGKSVLATIDRTATDIWLVRNFAPANPLATLRDRVRRLF